MDISFDITNTSLEVIVSIFCYCFNVNLATPEQIVYMLRPNTQSAPLTNGPGPLVNGAGPLINCISGCPLTNGAEPITNLVCCANIKSDARCLIFTNQILMKQRYLIGNYYAII